MASPTTNDSDANFIVWLSIVWLYIYFNPALRLPSINKPIVYPLMRYFGAHLRLTSPQP